MLTLSSLLSALMTLLTAASLHAPATASGATVTRTPDAAIGVSSRRRLLPDSPQALPGIVAQPKRKLAPDSPPSLPG